MPRMLKTFYAKSVDPAGTPRKLVAFDTICAPGIGEVKRVGAKQLFEPLGGSMLSAEVLREIADLLEGA